MSYPNPAEFEPTVRAYMGCFAQDLREAENRCHIIAATRKLAVASTVLGGDPETSLDLFRRALPEQYAQLGELTFNEWTDRLRKAAGEITPRTISGLNDLDLLAGLRNGEFGYSDLGKFATVQEVQAA